MIETKFNIANEENILTCVIANKVDIKKQLDDNQKSIIKDFISNKQLPLYEISTKCFFNFEKFFLEYLFSILKLKNNDILEENNFKSSLQKMVIYKSTFSKAKRESADPTEDNPGPDYDLNIFSFNTMKELKDSLVNKKSRFTKKIFYNKQGPIFCKSKSSKDFLGLENNDKNSLFISQTKGGLLNKPIEGYTFGIVKGKLELKKLRKKKSLERKADLMESIEGDCSLTHKIDIRNKDADYFIKAEQRKIKIKQSQIKERQIKLDKIAKLHQGNLEKIAQEKERQDSKSVERHRFIKSSSVPSLNYDGLNNLDENKEEEKLYNKQRFYEKVYKQNTSNLEKFYLQRYKIEQNKKENNEYPTETPGPNAYDIRGNMYDPNKGPSILGKRSDIIIVQDSPKYPDFKDEFEIIAAKAKKGPIDKNVKPRFQAIMKERDPGPYRDQEKWKKWNVNREKFQKCEMKKFLKIREDNDKNHIKNMQKLQEQNKEVQEMRKEILRIRERNRAISKNQPYYELSDIYDAKKNSFNDFSDIKHINYSLVEEASPKYSIKGRHANKNPNAEEFGSVLLGGNLELMEYIKNDQLNRPLPNIGNVRPSLPSIVFGKAERFKIANKKYEGSEDLFKDGVFAPKTQKDFSELEAFFGTQKRTHFSSTYMKSPSPSDYKIKSSFEIIAEQGKKISDNRDRIRKKEREELEKKNVNKSTGPVREISKMKEMFNKNESGEMILSLKNPSSRRNNNNDDINELD